MYKINEIFETLQGEASFTGTPAIFLRLQECPVGCSWCDTKHTWLVSPEYQVAPENIIEKSADSPSWTVLDAKGILKVIKDQHYRARHVVITGGEPCLFDLRPLCELLHLAGFSTQIETSGTFEVLAPEQTWVTVSPKVNMQGGYEVLQSALQRADEIKHPVATRKHIDELEALLLQHQVENKLIYLQPISQKPRATALAIEVCKQKNWRLSVQLHKYLGIN